MLAHPTLDQLNTLGLYGLAKGFKELEHKAEARGLALQLRIYVNSDFTGSP